MPGVTKDGVYIPSHKIAIASSFEGIVNDGVKECGLTSFNAYQGMDEGKGRFYGRVVEPREFPSIDGTREMRAFLLLRPVVEVAEDYLTVMQVIEENPGLVDTMLSAPDREVSYDPLIDKFMLKRSATPEVRARFKDAFYAERKRMQAADWDGWLNTQSPFPEAIVELRYLLRTQQNLPDGTVMSGFVPWFATSKDEQSTFDLCVFYGKVKKLDPEDVAQDLPRGCLITRGRIIGKERTTNKVEQLKQIASQEGVPRSQVWRLNDRYDPEQQRALADNGFMYQFLLAGGGYAFPHDVRKAEKDPLVKVVPRNGFAKALGAKTGEWGF